MKTELCTLFEKYKADKCPAVYHTYSPQYFRLLTEIRPHIKNVLEIGIGTVPLMEQIVGQGYTPGASIKAWRDFFPNANIYAIDIDETVLFTEERIFTTKVDQSSTDSIRSYLNSINNVNFDLIIDDGSHLIDHQIISIHEFSKRLNDKGIYIIEDVNLKYLGVYDDIQIPNLTRVYTHIGKKDPFDNFIVYKKNTSVIPKILHMVWVGKKDPPQYFWDNLNKWKKLMPTWEYMIWTNDKLTEEFFDKDYLELIKKVTNPSQVSDFIRFYVMNKWGGYYLDADVTPLRNLDELPISHPIVLCNDLPNTSPNYMMCAFMAGIPNHPLWERCVEECWNVDLSIEYGAGITPTGPYVLGYVSQQRVPWETVGGYTELPYWYFYRNRVGDPGPYMPNRIMRDHPDAFGNHFYAASWM
jgi:hypothetical protein